jgi:phosphate/sulfate permease
VHADLTINQYATSLHGSNDVSNAIGPVAAVIEAHMTGKIDVSSTAVPHWVLLMGGVGIVVGLATYGHRCMSTVGEKIIKLTFTRGFAAQIATALTVLTATLLGLSVSTTHCLVGSIAGIACVETVEKLNKQTLKRILISWAVTMPASAFFSYIVYFLLKAGEYSQAWIDGGGGGVGGGGGGIIGDGSGGAGDFTASMGGADDAVESIFR